MARYCLLLKNETAEPFRARQQHCNSVDRQEEKKSKKLDDQYPASRVAPASSIIVEIRGQWSPTMACVIVNPPPPPLSSRNPPQRSNGQQGFLPKPELACPSPPPPPLASPYLLYPASPGLCSAPRTLYNYYCGTIGGKLYNGPMVPVRHCRVVATSLFHCLVSEWYNGHDNIDTPISYS